MRLSRFFLLVACFGVCSWIGGAAYADPPASPPPCSVQIAPVFCFRTTDISLVPNTNDTYRFEFEVVNWTRLAVESLVLTLNTGPNPGANGVPAGAPHFSNAEIDFDGRPMGVGASPPPGNLGILNDWTMQVQTPTLIRFGGGTALPAPVGTFGSTTYYGLLDPAFAQASLPACISALTQMLPGSIYSGGIVSVPDVEYLDDGPNALDGFVVEITGWDPGEQLSFNWHLIDLAGSVVGSVAPAAGPGDAVLGDEYGFGTCNLVRMSGTAPEPLFDLNTGYNPTDTSDVNIDSASFWAETEVGGIDTYPLNPIPAGEPGEGSFFAVELGAATTAEFSNPFDNSFQFNGQVIQSGINLSGRVLSRGDCNVDGGMNIADVVFLLSVLFPPPGCIPDTDGVPDGPPECAFTFCNDACDSNDDGALNIGDAVSILSALFGPSLPLPPPNNCDVDTTEDSLGCARFAACP